MVVVKLMDLIGSSTKSWPDSVEKAVAKAGESVRHINEAEITSLKAKIENGKITEYLTSIRLSFLVE